eukprot:4701193-Pleurochrysis_carterae.AAC.3
MAPPFEYTLWLLQPSTTCAQRSRLQLRHCEFQWWKRSNFLGDSRTNVRARTRLPRSLQAQASAKRNMQSTRRSSACARLFCACACIQAVSNLNGSMQLADKMCTCTHLPQACSK